MAVVVMAVVVAVVRALALGAAVCSGDAFQASESDSAIAKRESITSLRLCRSSAGQDKRNRQSSSQASQA